MAKLKLYSTAQGKEAFDWNEALDICIKNGASHRYHEVLAHKAESWTTCACGNQCEIIPRALGGQPYDRILRDLGGSFYELVDDGKWEAAKSCLERIEKRSAFLINQIKENEN